MATYLSLSGVGTYIKIPTITFDEIRMDYTPYDAFNGGLLYHIDARDSTQTTNPMLYSDTVDNEIYSSFDFLIVNGNVVSSGANSIGSGQHVSIIARDAPKTVAPTLFARYTNIQNLKADIFSITFISANVVVASYDMSTGTLNDQSGNGNHATMSGGTWEGATAPTSTPVSSTFSTKQVIYKEDIHPYSVEQIIFANKSNDYVLEQRLYESITEQYSTRHIIMKVINALYDTQQDIYRESIQRINSYDISLQIYKDVEKALSTKQSIYKGVTTDNDLKQALFKAEQSNKDISIVIYEDVERDFDLKQIIHVERIYTYDLEQKLFDPDKSLIGKVKLKGDRAIGIYLVGQREEETINLKGSREINVRMRGDLL
jgi:hypothetical protein